MATLKQRIKKKNNSGSYDTLHIETNSNLVLMDNGNTLQYEMYNHTHTTGQISNFPSSMNPSYHTHSTGDIWNFPSTMTPSYHTHTKSQITDFPSIGNPLGTRIYYTSLSIPAVTSFNSYSYGYVSSSVINAYDTITPIINTIRSNYTNYRFIEVTATYNVTKSGTGYVGLYELNNRRFILATDSSSASTVSKTSVSDIFNSSLIIGFNSAYIGYSYSGYNSCSRVSATIYFTYIV